MSSTVFFQSSSKSGEQRDFNHHDQVEGRQRRSCDQMNDEQFASKFNIRNQSHQLTIKDKTIASSQLVLTTKNSRSDQTLERWKSIFALSRL